MNLATLALLAATAGQPAPAPAPDYFPHRSRSLKLGIAYNPAKRNEIQQVQLLVCKNQSGVWELVDTVTPDKEFFPFTAKDDGIYWLNMVIVYRNGQKDPPDVSRVAPAQKLLIDATPPSVRLTAARRDGDDIVVEWSVEDKFPADGAQVTYQIPGTGDTGWIQVPASEVGKRSARFKPTLTGPILVQVAAADLAGNVGRASQEIPSATTAAYTAPTVEDPKVPVVVPAEGPAAPGGPLVPGGPLPPPVLPTDSGPAVPSVPSNPVVTQQPAPAPAPWTAAEAPRPIAVGTGASSAVAPAGAKVINFARFDMDYQVENGPSGVSRVDLYVTRDEGRSWSRWSQHDGRETPLRVALDTRANPQLEGDYGFRLVPVSGAGLSDGAPTAGNTPDFRVHIDTTPPVVKVYQPTGDPAQRNVLNLHWEATDRNFGADPISIEWSEQPTGPWKSVTSQDVVPVVAGAGAGNGHRVANSGNYAWNLPAGLATHKVFLKFTAVDLAGNRSEVVTPSPVMVDLTKPRAKIQGILTARP